MKKVLVCFIAIFCSTTIVACSPGYSKSNDSPLPTVSDETKAALNKKVNCQTARADIKTLEDERASVFKQTLSGVRAVFPIAAAVGLLSGDYQDRVQVATGQYNADLEAKVDQIRRTCGIAP